MNTTTNAADAYRAARERIDQALNQINHLLRAHAERQAADRGDWGYVGDLNRLIQIFNDDVIEPMGGTKETTK